MGWSISQVQRRKQKRDDWEPVRSVLLSFIPSHYKLGVLKQNRLLSLSSGGQSPKSRCRQGCFLRESAPGLSPGPRGCCDPWGSLAPLQSAPLSSCGLLSLCLLSSHEDTCHWIQGILIQDGLISTSLVIPAKTLYLNKLTFRGIGWTYILGEPSLNPLHMVNLDMLPCVLTFLRKKNFVATYLGDTSIYGMLGLCYLPAVCPWADCLTVLCLSLLICKMEALTVLPPIRLLGAIKGNAQERCSR